MSGRALLNQVRDRETGRIYYTDQAGREVEDDASQKARVTTPSAPSLSADPDVARAHADAAALQARLERERNTVKLADGTTFVIDPDDAAGTAARLSAVMHSRESEQAKEGLADYLLAQAKALPGARAAAGAASLAAGAFSERTRDVIRRMGYDPVKIEAEAAAELRARADVGGVAANAELGRLAAQCGVTAEQVARYGGAAQGGGKEQS